MKILILGAKGMLGSAVSRVVETQSTFALAVARATADKNFVSLRALDKTDLDISQRAQVLNTIQKFQPEVVINCAGYTDVDGSEENQELAFDVNGRAVGYLAEACSKVVAGRDLPLLIHFSTDYVFAGNQPQGYREEDKPSPINIYGKSKLLGEKLITQLPNYQITQSCRYFLIRTSWLYGPNHKNFVDTMLFLAQKKNELKIVNDQFGKPTYTVDLAKRVCWIIENRQDLKSGIYHCVNRTNKSNMSDRTNRSIEEVCGISWYEFAIEIFKQAQALGLIKKMPKIVPCASSEFPRAAERPNYSALLNTKLPQMRDWKDALGEYLQLKV